MKKNKLKRTEIGMIPEDWGLTTLEKISLIVTDGSHFSPKENPNGTKIIATVKNMTYNGFNFRNCKIISDFDYENLLKSCCSPEKGDILISKDGAKCLDIIFVYNQGKKIVVLSSIALARLKTDYNPYFYRYFLLSPIAQKIMREGYISGSAIPRVIIKDFKKIPVPKPPRETQNLIAKILSDLDAKIELNQQMNKTLESIGQAIFKHWFIDFEFPSEKGNPYKSSGGEMVYNEDLGKEIPKEWEVKKIGEVLNTILGGTPDRTKKEYWSGNIPWINSGKINEFRIIEPTEYITKKGLDNSATQLLPKRTTVLAITGATLGQVSLLEIDSCTNQSVIGVLESEKISSEYIYFYIKYIINKIISWQTGGAQQHINKTNVNNSLIVIPDRKIMSNYLSFCKELFDRITINCFESTNLSQLRDSLLPKLISGKIRVPVEVRK